MTAYMPDLYHFMQFNADPGDVTGVPVWINLGTMVTKMVNVGRGRQYELARTRVNDIGVTMRDPNEYLNAANTSSPYYPFAQPYREMLHLACWRSQGTLASGQSGNLLNLSNWRVPADGSFESYALGLSPGWLTANTIGAVTSTTNPQAGTRCLLGATAASAVRQGLTWNVACVPGMTYTSSAYVWQAAACTQEIRVTDQTLLMDMGDRTTASGWGAPPAGAPESGGTWTLTGGSNSDRSTTPATPYSPAFFSLALPTVTTVRYQTQGSMRDGRQRMRFTVPAVATGGYMSVGLLARYADASNHYYAEARFGTDRVVTLRVYSRVAGADTQVGSTATLDGVYYNAGDEFYLDFWVTGTMILLNAWRSGDVTPSGSADGTLVGAWEISTSSSSITAAGAFGVRGVLESTNTNVSPTWQLYNISAVGSVLGSTTTSTGAYVRLSVTWTATQPRHAVTLSTTGTALAGAVNVDSVQHEQAASASAFASTGATIYPLDRHFVERFPRTYESAGFEGFADLTCVPNLAVASAITLPTEYDYAVRKLSPDYYWPLTGGEGATLFPDATNNVQPPLRLNISKYGIGELPQAGSSIAVPGINGSGGVEFFAPTPATGTALGATGLGIGRLVGDRTSAFTVPASLAGTAGVWRLTVAAWIQITSSGATGQTLAAALRQVTSNGTSYAPFSLSCTQGISYTNYVPATGANPSLASGTGLSGINVLDGLPHLVMGIVVQDTAGDTAVYYFIDDTLDGIATATTASLGGPLGAQSDSLVVGAYDDGYRFSAVTNGVISRLGIWNRELSPSETLGLYQAGRLAFAGETSADRNVRHIAQSGYVGASRVSGKDAVYDDGYAITTMQAPSWTDSIDLLSDLAGTQEAEQGGLWPDADGAICTELRSDRFLRLTSSWTLGEDAASGEYPYEGDIAFDFDPTFVFGDVTVSRPGGGAGIGGLPADIATTRRRFLPRNFSMSQDFEDDQVAQDAADFIFYTHRAPNLRVAATRMRPSGNPALWAFVLGARPGDRVTVKRRAKAANAGAGLTVSLDFFIEQLTHPRVDFDRGEWTFELWLSPIGSAPGPTLQPWILENATYGVLDSTTVLGF